MIFFGAGASFGSDFINETPLIGKDLFKALASYDKNGWGSIPDELAHDFTPDFESGMVRYGNKYSRNVSLLQRTMACYFFNFEPGLSNLYRKLSKRIINTQWSGSISTVNYDLLLQRSFTLEGLSLIADGLGFKFQKSEIEVELILPHGSCNLFDADVKSPGNMVFDYRCLKTLGRNIKMIRDYNEFKIEISNKIPPVMCYYQPIKSVNAGKEFIEEQKKRFKKRTQEADIICIVGIKVNQNDKDIWGPLAKAKGRLFYCSGAKAAEEFEGWKRNNRKGRKDKIIFKKFDDGFKEICETIGI